MILKYLEGSAYVVAFVVIGLTYVDCLMTIAGTA
jgi:hypothetical protein